MLFLLPIARSVLSSIWHIYKQIDLCYKFIPLNDSLLVCFFECNSREGCFSRDANAGFPIPLPSLGLTSFSGTTASFVSGANIAELGSSSPPAPSPSPEFPTRVRCSSPPIIVRLSGRDLPTPTLRIAWVGHSGSPAFSPLSGERTLCGSRLARTLQPLLPRDGVCTLLKFYRLARP